MKALVVTAEGEMRALEVKDPVPLVLKIKKANEYSMWDPKKWGDFEPGDYALCSLLAPTDEKMTVAVYEEDGAPEEVDDLI